MSHIDSHVHLKGYVLCQTRRMSESGKKKTEFGLSDTLGKESSSFS